VNHRTGGLAVRSDRFQNISVLGRSTVSLGYWFRSFVFPLSSEVTSLLGLVSLDCFTLKTEVQRYFETSEIAHRNSATSPKDKSSAIPPREIQISENMSLMWITSAQPYRWRWHRLNMSCPKQMLPFHQSSGCAWPSSSSQRTHGTSNYRASQKCSQ
jgi:hypothetical protein